MDAWAASAPLGPDGVPKRATALASRRSHARMERSLDAEKKRLGLLWFTHTQLIMSSCSQKTALGCSEASEAEDARSYRHTRSLPRPSVMLPALNVSPVMKCVSFAHACAQGAARGGRGERAAICERPSCPNARAILLDPPPPLSH